MSREDPNFPESYFVWNVAQLGMGLLVVAFILFFVYFPMYWAIGTAAGFVLVSGLGTSRLVLGTKGYVKTSLMTLLCGSGWLLFFWLLMKLVQ
jgi:hypothetical protein